MTKPEFTNYEMLMIASVFRSKIRENPAYFGTEIDSAQEIVDKVVTYFKENDESFIDVKLDVMIKNALNENKNKKGD